MRKIISVTVAILITLSNISLVSANTASTAKLPLDLRGHWPELYVITMIGQEIITAYPDGRFYPNKPVSEEEAAVILHRILENAVSNIFIGRGTGAADAEYSRETTDLPKLPDYRIIDVPYISQLYPVPAPVGCEPVSLLMGLKAKGYALDVDIRSFLDAMPKHGSNPDKGFVGSPYTADKSKKTRTTIHPPMLAEFGKSYGNVIDISGASVERIQKEVLSGNPIVAYVTMNWEKPFYRSFNIEGETRRLLSNNHALLVCGYDVINNQYFVADPYNKENLHEPYFYWVEGAIFDPLYSERHHAVMID